METYQARKFAAAGIAATFVQDNHSRSGQGILLAAERYNQSEPVNIGSAFETCPPWT